MSKKHHDLQDLNDLLERDARHIRRSEPDFDPALHRDVVRTIRDMASGRSADPRPGRFPFKLTAGLATAAATAVVFLLVLRPSPPPVPPGPVAPTGTGTTVTRAPEPRPSSALAYRRALVDGEDALVAMLEADARVLLPESAGVFKRTP